MAAGLRIDFCRSNAPENDPGGNVVRVGVIGYGYWGPNIVRNFHAQDRSRVVAVCDKSVKSLQRVRQAHPEIPVTQECRDVLEATDIDVAAIVTPVWTHYELAKAALENGKHVFVEKPFTCTTAQAEELIELAERKHLKIMVDHTFLFTGAVKRMKEFIEDGTLGKLYYYDSTRVNLGLFQHDVNVIWDLAPHDLSIMDYLIKEKPEAVVATGEGHLNGVVDVAFLTLYYPDNMIGHINVNWLSPVKVRTTLIGGEKKMLVWNDLEADEKIKVYDKGVQMATGEGVYKLLISYRSGDMWLREWNRLRPSSSRRPIL
jgi:predicted dehydrogenase